MARYFDKVKKTEARVALGQVNDDCVILPDDNPFWHQLPTGKIIGFDAEGLPVLIDEPPPPVEALERTERAWRDGEVAKVVAWLDQIRNDEQFGVATYSKPYSAEQLNAYRVALCNYPEQENFPNGIRPNIDDYSEPL